MSADAEIEAVEDRYARILDEIDNRGGEVSEEEWAEKRRLVEEQRDAEIESLRSMHEEAPTEEFIEEMADNFDFEHSWDLAAMDDGEDYGGYPLGKAFMLSAWMQEWSAYKSLNPDSPGARIGAMYYDKKKHKIKGKKERAAERQEGRVAAMHKAEGGRFPVELPKGSKVRKGVTDEGAHDIDEDTDAEWREALRLLKERGII